MKNRSNLSITRDQNCGGGEKTVCTLVCTTHININKREVGTYIVSITTTRSHTIMTGVANVTSHTTFDELQATFINWLHANRCTAALKAAWQNLCVCKAAIEITAGEKQKAADIHRDMFWKYMKWVEHLLTPGSVVTEDTPEYVTEGMMKTVDVAGKKEYKGTADGKKMWSKWHRLRKDILNRDNIAVAKGTCNCAHSK